MLPACLAVRSCVRPGQGFHLPVPSPRNSTVTNPFLFQQIFGDRYHQIPLASNDRLVFKDVVTWMRSRGDAPKTLDEAETLAVDALRLVAAAANGLGRDDSERTRSYQLAKRLCSAQAMTAVAKMLLEATHAHR